MAKNDILVRIGLRGIDKFKKELKSASFAMRKAGQNMKRNGEELSRMITLPVAGVGVAAVVTAAKFEKLQVSMNTLTGSAKEGVKAFERLKVLSAGTPFQLEDLVKAQNTLMGFSLSSDEAFESVKMLGDIAAITGADMSRLSVTFGQAAAEGKVMTKDIREFINNGVPMVKILAEEMGVAESSIFDLASEGKITFDVLTSAFQRATAEGGMFANGMEKQSKTIGGLFSTLQDNVSILLADIGQAIVDAGIRELIIGITDAARGLVERFNNLSPAVKKFIVIIAGLAAAFGPVLIVLGQVKIAIAALGFSTGALGVHFFKMIKQMPLMIGAFGRFGLSVKAVNIAMRANPIGLVITAISLLIPLLVTLYNNFEPVRKVVDSVWSAMKFLGETIGSFLIDRIKALGTAFSAIKDIMAGRVKEGFKKLGQVIIQENPIGIAVQEAKKLANKMADAYKEKMMQRAKDMQDATNQVFEFASGALLGTRQVSLDQFITGGNDGEKKIKKKVKEVAKKIVETTEADLSELVKLFKSAPVQMIDEFILGWNKGRVVLTESIVDPFAEIFDKAISVGITESFKKSRDSVKAYFDSGAFDFINKNVLGFGDINPMQDQESGDDGEEPAWFKQIKKYASIAQDILGGLFDFWAQSQENREAKAQQNYERELERIENSTMSEKAKEQAISKLNAEREKEERKFARERAKREKAQALFNAVIAGAVAVLNALAQGPVVAAIVGAIAAAKVATIAAEPLPALAEGGLAYGPTTALVGDNMNARVNPEVIAPLDKLKGMMGGGGNIRLSGNFRIDGQDLIYVIEENQQIRERR